MEDGTHIFVPSPVPHKAMGHEISLGAVSVRRATIRLIYLFCASLQKRTSISHPHQKGTRNEKRFKKGRSDKDIEEEELENKKMK